MVNPGDAFPPGEDFVVRRLEDLQRQITHNASGRSLESSSIGAGGLKVMNGGSIIVEPGGDITLSSGTFSASIVNASASVNAPTINATGTVSGPQGTFASGLSSVGAYSTDVSLLSGARQSVWQHHTGVYGYAPSTIAAKTDLGPVPFTAADVLAVSPYMFHYKGQIAIRDDPENPEYDPSYVVPWEIGLMAEHLIAHNMSCFVFWEADGITPKGINYDLFGAIAPLVVARDHEQRLANLEQMAK